MTERPHPIDMTAVRLPEELLQSIERLAEDAHDIWTRQTLAGGSTYGPNPSMSRRPNVLTSRQFGL